MTGRDVFALPPVTPGTTKMIMAVVCLVDQMLQKGSDPRDVIKSVVEHYDAKLTYPTYRTALRCTGIYSEAATSCSLSTAKLLLHSFTEKASRYLQDARAGDLFAPRN